MGILYRKTSLRNQLYQKYGGRCAYCGCKIKNSSYDWHVDHIVPLKRHIKGQKSELNVLDNYNPACPSCNSSKSDLSIEKWRDGLQWKLEKSVNDDPRFKILLRFGLVKVTKKPIIFYFERIENG